MQNSSFDNMAQTSTAQLVSNLESLKIKDKLETAVNMTPDICRMHNKFKS